MTLILSGTNGLSDVDGTAATPAIRGTDANTGIFFPAADTIAFSEGGTEIARFDSSGNLGLGTDSPTARLTVRTGAAGSNEGEIRISDNATYYAGLRRVNATDEFRIGSYGASQNLTFYTVASERMRIDSSGNLLVGTTSNPTSNRINVSWNNSSVGGMRFSPSSSSYNQSAIEFYDNGSTRVGYIYSNGSATTYSTSSDYRLKQDVQPMVGALASVSQLKPVTYKWKADGSDGQGFIAHELQEVVPDCVTGEKDAVDENGNPVYQGIDTSFLVATLTAALQELKALVDTQASTITALQADVEALKAQP